MERPLAMVVARDPSVRARIREALESSGLVTLGAGRLFERYQDPDLGLLTPDNRDQLTHMDYARFPRFHGQEDRPRGLATPVIVEVEPSVDPLIRSTPG